MANTTATITSLVIRATLLLAGSGCASLPTVVPGTGDISFRLLWDGPADLDLHVRSPLGEEVWFAERYAESGGVLDVDCNATPETMCEDPLENVFWPPGAAPEGTYEYWVQLLNWHGTTLPVPFRVLVLRGARVVRERRGSLRELRSGSETWSATHRTIQGSGLDTASRLSPAPNQT